MASARTADFPGLCSGDGEGVKHRTSQKNRQGTDSLRGREKMGTSTDSLTVAVR
jgi:hypothetical protein